MDKKNKPSQSMDMQFARPEAKKSQCPTCKYRKPDSVFKNKDGSTTVIEQWCNCACEKYDFKPVGVVFGDVHCTLYEKA